jgi:predicted amidophosphoribosyltransferase
MSLGGRLSASGRRKIRERLIAEMGGYLRNVVREPHVTCAVCATPIKPAFELCLRCWRDAQEFGTSLADLVVPVCYGIRRRQSGYLMHSYKDLEAPARHNQTLLSVLLLAALDLHGECIERRLGHDIDAWAFVPSVRADRTGEHPLHVVAKRAGLTLPEIELLIDERAAPAQRVTSADRFALAATSHVRDRHVLLIEDTWTTGGNAQSAALTLRGAEAASVTIVALARWLTSDEPLIGEFITQRLIGDYDPLVCPVNHSHCTRLGGLAGD